MKINGLKVPDSLVQLIENKKWDLPANIEKLLQLPDLDEWDVETLVFLDLNGIAEDHYKFKDLKDVLNAMKNEKCGSSKILGRKIEDSSIIDCDTSLCIIYNIYDIGIYLDYRFSVEPIVVMSYWGKDAPPGYIKIADNFDEFIELIGLTG